ncbi:MAG: fibronectin type III domain-containing protein [Nitrospirae bacterium]|nr:fibronectin type III domain-containing protein [Nitrospirota bacterium]
MKLQNIILYILIALFLSGSSGYAMAAQGMIDDWGVTVSVSTPYPTVPGGIVSIPLSAGIRTGASDKYDNAMDTVSFLSADAPLQAHFPHGAVIKDNNAGGVAGWDCPNPESGYNPYQCSLWRDFRALNQTVTWDFEVVSTINGATISLNWQIDGGPIDPSEIELTLVDLSATPPMPPMRLDGSSQYQYTNFFAAGNKFGLRKFEIRMKTSGLFITPPTLQPGVLNSSYSESLQAIGGNVMWSLESGDLPPGLRLDTSSGQIEGIPQSEGVYSFTVRAIDPVIGNQASHNYTLQILPPLIITTPDLPGGELYSSYSETLGVSGGTPPFTWKLSSGSLPEGISLDKDSGTLSGDLSVPGIFDFAIQVGDSVGAKTIRTYHILVTEQADTTPPTAISDLRVLYTTPSTAILAWSAPQDDSITGTAAAYDLRYSKDCPAGQDMTWWDTALQAIGEPRPQSATLHTYTLGGVEAGQNYCAAIQSMDASGHVSANSNVVRFPDGSSQYDTNFSVLTTRQYHVQKGYNLISIPMIALPSDTSIFENAIGGTASVYRWYSAYPGLTEAQWYMEGNVHPGYGYFLYVPDQGITLDITGMEINDSQYIVRLQGGWNMIGNPYEVDITLKDVLIREVKDTGDGKSKSFEDAAKSGLVGNSLYAFNGLDYEFLAVNDDPPAVLKPWAGFWLYVQEGKDYEMIFRKPQK